MKNRKLEIIEISITLIKEYGFDSFSYKDLSERVGITKATLHHHFPKKLDLGLAICDYLENGYLNFGKGLETLDDPIERLRQLFKLNIGNPNEICPISSLQAEYNIIPDEMKIKLNKMASNELTLVSSILKDGLDKGVFNFKFETKDMAFMILSMYKGGPLYFRSKESFSKENFFQNSIDILT